MTGLVLLLAAAALGQTFEVASVKPGPSGTIMELIRSGKFHENIDDAQVDLGSIPLAGLISMAYQLDLDRISGPDWMNELRFDVRAKLPSGGTKEQVPAMLQTLLTERFKLAVRHQEKIMPVYALVVGKSGPKLQESKDNDPKALEGCYGGRGGHHVCHKVDMEELAIRLTILSKPGMQTWSGIDRPVIDATGLKGVYDFDLDYGPGGAGRGGRKGGDAPVMQDAPPISVFDSLQKLGLKLEPQKRPLDFLIVDHVEKVPLDN